MDVMMHATDFLKQMVDTNAYFCNVLTQNNTLLFISFHREGMATSGWYMFCHTPGIYFFKPHTLTSVITLQA
jgi:hypothetical protein